jgi:Protein of unknown function with HXXEE motif
MRQLFNTFSDTWLIFWLVLFPLTYLLHIAEEYWGGGGYSAYLMKSHLVEMTPLRFLLLQFLGMFLMLVGVGVSVPLRFPLTMLTILAAVIFANGLVHASRSFIDWSYTPGVVTAVLLWIPLGTFSLLRTWNDMRIGRFTFAVLTGIAISVLVEVIAMRGGRVLISMPRQ